MVEVPITEPQIIYDHEQFEIKDSVLTKYLGTNLDVEIPKGVKEIGESAFRGNPRIRRVSIPFGVKNIMRSAFANCTMLTSVELPETLSNIGGGAFQSCVSLNEIKLPANVRIAEWAFYDCKSLSKMYAPSLSAWLRHGQENIFDYNMQYDLYIENSLLETVTLQEAVIPQRCFLNCKSLKKVIFAKGVKIIDREAFFNSACQEIEIGDTVEEIHQEAFHACKLTKLYIPKNVVVIERTAFDCCDQLEEVTLPSAFRAITESIFGQYNRIQFTFYD